MPVRETRPGLRNCFSLFERPRRSVRSSMNCFNRGLYFNHKPGRFNKRIDSFKMSRRWNKAVC